MRQSAHPYYRHPPAYPSQQQSSPKRRANSLSESNQEDASVVRPSISNLIS
jgi:hypothetical protein